MIPALGSNHLEEILASSNLRHKKTYKLLCLINCCNEDEHGGLSGQAFREDRSLTLHTCPHGRDLAAAAHFRLCAEGEHPMPSQAWRPRFVRAAALKQMEILGHAILGDSALAQEASAIAHSAERRGRQHEAEVLRAVARNHRIRILEAQGRLAVLGEFLAVARGGCA